MNLHVKFVPQDLWIGLYWKRIPLFPTGVVTRWYLCVVPCCPIIWDTYPRKK